MHWFHLLGSLKNLTIGLIWLVTRGGGVGGVGQGGGQGGEDGGGHQRAVWEQQGVHWFHLFGQGGEMGAAERWEVKWRGLTRCGGL